MIDVSDVFCIYRGPERDVAALRGLTLDVAAGERVLIHGPSGSGKTTLMRVLAGVERPSAGRAIVDGVDLGGADRGALADHTRRALGMIDQRGGRNLRPELRAVDNVGLQLGLLGHGGSERRRLARALLDDLGLGDLARRWPYQLSGGEAQRVGVCAAVAHSPKLILADEPTGELDAASADEVYDLLAEIAGRNSATLLIVSHDPRAARIVDRVVRIRDGRLSGERAPAHQTDEALVVDERGWLRLPDDLRRAAGIGGRASASIDEGGLRIEPIGPAPADDGSEAFAVPLPDEPAPVREVVARMRGVRRAYGGRAVLDGLDLEVPSGALTILRGRSGSGKSTLLRILCGLDRADAGLVEVAGRDLTELDRSGLAEFRRDSVAVMLQQVALADALDPYENLELSIALWRGRGGARVDEICGALGLDVLRSRPARLLSGGERQRVAVARALVADTPLALLDEPSSQLDEANAGIVADLLRREGERGRAVVCATHDPVLVERGHLVIDLVPDDQHSTTISSRGTRDSTSMPSSVMRNVSM
jgi:ABC-type lipoprotein export system ATPase subunit